MEKAAGKLTEYLIKKAIIDEEKQAIYRYGFQIGLEVCLNTIISIIIAAVLGMTVEMIVFFSVFMALRSCSGGLHLDSYIGCMCASCASLLFLLLFIKYVYIPPYISIGMVLISLVVIQRLAPVQDINRPLTDKQIAYFKKKLSYVFVMVVMEMGLFISLNKQRLSLTVAVTMAFMVGVLVFGKIKNKRVHG